MRVVLATKNPGKLREFEQLLAPLGIELEPLTQFTPASAQETGRSFVENAILKARHAAQASGLAALADDSGLEVDALQGAPGIHSARYAGEGASDRDNLEKLLDALRATPPAQRTARYQCAIAFVRSPSDPSPLVCQAAWEGRIVTAPRGTGGFGYDPIFEVADLGRTAAELTPEEKNRLSHRGQAIRQLAARLRKRSRCT